MVATTVLAQVEAGRLQRAVEGLVSGAYTITVTAEFDHGLGARAHSFDVAGQVQRLGNKEVDVTALNFPEVNLVGASVFGGEFLEEKDVDDKAVQYCVAEKKGLQVPAKLRQLFLHAANEDSQSSRCHG